MALAPPDPRLLTPGKVRVQSLPGSRLLGLPVAFRLTPRGTMLWTLDEALIDPILIPKLTVLGNITLGAIQSPVINPSRVRIHRDHSLTDGHLISADITADAIDVRIQHSLIRAPLQDPLEQQATYVLREVQRTLAILGQDDP